jgi:hypothetical protein
MSVQIMDVSRIAKFELTAEDCDVNVVDEKHYKLLPAAKISKEDLGS